MERWISKYTLVVVLLPACEAAYDDTDVFRSGGHGGLDSEFEGAYETCDEFAGVGVVPFENVRSRVPSDYTVVEVFPGFAAVVAQSGRCEGIQVGVLPPRPGAFAQFGVMIVPPDGSTDSAFYQLMFTSTNAALAARLRRSGANAKVSPGLEYSITGSEPVLHVSAPRPADLAWMLDGPITLPDPAGPPNPVTTFNYWHQSHKYGNVRQSNAVTGIRLGEGSGVVLTAVGEELQEIIGGGSLSFAFFSSPEVFDLAELTATTDVL